MELTEKSVLSVYAHCLLHHEEPTKCITPIDGVYHRGILLHPGRLETHREAIAELIAQLGPSFDENHGGQYLMDARKRGDGTGNWTEHDTTVDMLFILGQGINLLKHVTDKGTAPLVRSGAALISRV